MMISNIRENGEPIGALPDGEMMFHHDMIHADHPEQGHPALFARNPLGRRQHAVCQRLRGLRHARSGDPQSPGGPPRQASLQLRRRGQKRSQGDCGLCRKRAPGVPHPRGDRPQGGLRQPSDDGRHRRHAAGGSRAAARSRVRPRREARVRLRACLARRRPVVVGQPLLVARPPRFSFDRAAADAAHHRQRQRDGPPDVHARDDCVGGCNLRRDVPPPRKPIRAGRSSWWCRSSPAAPPTRSRG